MSQGLTPGTPAFRQEYQKEYRQTANYKSSHRARQKIYNQTDEGKVKNRARQKRYYQKNADKKKAYQKEQREKKKAQVDSSVQMGRENTVSSRVSTGISAKLMSQGLTPGTTTYRQEYQKLYRQTDEGKVKLKAAQQTYRQSLRGKAAQQAYYERKKKVQVDSSVQMGRPWATPSAIFRKGAPLQHETSGNEGVNQRMRGAELTS
ncbi:hypothetical protein, partial [Photobacterium leiognathi]